MPTIKILNRDYQIACGPGQEAKLIELASKLDQRLNDNAKLFKGANEATLIVLTALMLEDSLHDLQSAKHPQGSDSQIPDGMLDELSDRIDSIAKKISK